jgi:hypothetical protein
MGMFHEGIDPMLLEIRIHSVNDFDLCAHLHRYKRQFPLRCEPYLRIHLLCSIKRRMELPIIWREFSNFLS